MDFSGEESIKRDIKLFDFAPVYLLFGDDTYLKKHYSDALIKKICGDDTDFNLQIFEETALMQDVFDAINQFPMMADKKCVCLNDYDIEHADSKDFTKLCEIVSDVPDTTVFILKFDSAPFDYKSGTKAKKLITAAQKSGGKAVLLNHRSQSELVQMLCRGAKKRGSVLSDKAARYLIEVVGDDINILINELDKLCLFSGEKEITEQTVDFVSSKSVDASVYDYVKEIFACNVTKALSLLDGMFFMHIEPMIILYTTAASFIDMIRIYFALNAGKRITDVTTDFSYGKRSFLLDRANKNLKKFDFKKLNKSLNQILKTDKDLKSFKIDERVALEELTVKLILIIAGEGDAV